MTAPPPGAGGGSKRRDYARVRLDDAQIAAGDYKAYLGGNAEGWDARGRFQLALLRHLGLREADALLDIGCGPLRAGEHFIRFLRPGGYVGFDYNASFVAAARRLVAADPALAARRPRIEHVDGFAFETLGTTFDRLLCFSVLNHCTPELRARFFARVPAAMHAGSRLLVTHAGWFDPAMLAGTPLAVARRIDEESQLPAGLALSAWGFDGVRDRLPVVEFVLR